MAAKLLGNDVVVNTNPNARSMTQPRKTLVVHPGAQLEVSKLQSQHLDRKYSFLKITFANPEYESLYQLVAARRGVRLTIWVAIVMVLLTVIHFLFFMGAQRFRNLPSYDVFDPNMPEVTCPINSTQHAFLPAYGVTMVAWGAFPMFITLCILSVLFAIVGVVIFVSIHASLRLIMTYSAIMVALLLAAVYVTYILRVQHSASDQLGLLIFVIFAIYTMTPIPLRVSCIMSLIISAFHILLTALVASLAQPKTASQPGTFEAVDWTVALRQAIANVIILLVVNLIGVFFNYIGDISQRKAFSETRRFLRSLLAISLDNKKIDRLLVSILPKNMIDDFKEKKLDQFVEQTKNNKAKREDKKSRAFRELDIELAHNVSILFADIVGFTRLSSGCTPQDLVKTLNELFGRFDQLAAAHNCLRIKILGDCYYCVSGLLSPCDNHADNCIKMGLAMVEAIREVRNATGVPVNMRVGVHTGEVLYGTLGEKKTQFDVWSNDVTLANHLESGGLPGRVHISEATKDAIQGSFELEEGNGMDRDQLLKEQNITTYLVVDRTNSRKQSSSAELDSRGSIVDQMNPLARHMEQWGASLPFSDGNTETLAETITLDSISSNTDRSPSPAPAPSFPMTPVRRKSVHHGEFRIEEETLRDMKNIALHKGRQPPSRSDHSKAAQMKELATNAKIEKFSFFYKNKEYNRKYLEVPDKYFKFYLYCTFMVFVAIFTVHLIMEPKQVYSNLPIGVIGVVYYGIFSFIFSLHICRDRTGAKQPNILIRLSLWFIRCTVARVIIAVCGLLFVMLVPVIMFVNCRNAGESLRPDFYISNCACNLTFDQWNQSVFNPNPEDNTCLYPEYFLYTAQLALIAPVVFIRLNWIIKTVLLFIGIVVYDFVVGFGVPCLFDDKDKMLHGFCTPCGLYTPLKLELSLYIHRLFFALIFVFRYSEKGNRVAFLRKLKSREEKDKKKITEEISVLLLRNILPDHVAQYYIDNGQHTTELYSESHENVCVIFAALHGWEDYYDQNPVNLHGKECLRLLNEIMWDFDEVLERPRYISTIEKIKLIGGTYMAVAGLKQKQDNDIQGGRRRMNHVSTMTDFAFDLMRALDNINGHAFTEFKLKIGINYGPVVAGVIGAQKPLYDIWGDTVNVSSRMYSTGEPGKIQVTEETARTLSSLGYSVEKRGQVFVKGKGDLTTYFVLGRTSKLMS
jgi:class 3 adenylate cyclase